MQQNEIIDLVQKHQLDTLKALSSFQDITQNVAFYDNSKLAHKVFNRPSANSQPNELISNFAHLLVTTLVNFMFARDVEFELVSGDAKTFDAFKKAYKQLKFNLYDPALARDLFAYGQALESISYSDTIRAAVHSIKENTVYPVLDDFNNLIVLIREYYPKMLINSDVVTDKRVTEVWTDSMFQKYVDDVLVEERINTKIPFVYYSLESPVWYDAKQLIDRQEVLLSVLADVNDYFGHPLWKRKGGTAEDFDIKRQTVGVIAVEEGDIDILELKSKPEQLSYELDTVTSLIFKLAHVPDLSFENMKGLGNLSGVALRLLFLDTILQTEQLFKSLFKFERRVNLLKHWLSIEYSDNKFNELQINVKLADVLPRDIESIIRQIVQSYSAGLISLQTAIERNPLVHNTSEELKRLESDSGESFNL